MESETELAQTCEKLCYWKTRARSAEIGRCDVSGHVQFQPRKELQNWLDGDPTSEHDMYPLRYDCDDFALDLSINALQDSYWIGLAVEDNHMFNWTIIGNDIYRIGASRDTIAPWLMVDYEVAGYD